MPGGTLHELYGQVAKLASVNDSTSKPLVCGSLLHIVHARYHRDSDDDTSYPAARRSSPVTRVQPCHPSRGPLLLSGGEGGEGGTVGRQEEGFGKAVELNPQARTPESVAA